MRFNDFDSKQKVICVIAGFNFLSAQDTPAIFGTKKLEASAKTHSLLRTNNYELILTSSLINQLLIVNGSWLMVQRSWLMAEGGCPGGATPGTP